MLNKLKAIAISLADSAIVVKAFHTFWQTFLPVWALTGFKLDKVALIAATAAGLSAVKTLAVNSVKVARS